MTSIAIPCIGAKSYNSIELTDLKNKLFESSDTDVPPGVYTFENVGVLALGIIPDSKAKLTIEGVPFIKSFFMKLFITGKIGGISLIFFPFIASLTTNTYTLTIDFPIDIPSEENNFFAVGVIDLDNPEPLLNLTNQRHTLTVEYKFLDEEYNSFFSVYRKLEGRAFMYVGYLCSSVTINVPE